MPQLTDFVNMALQQLGFCKDVQKSVLSAWISPDGHYGFCEVRTVEEATAALTYLNGIQVGAYCLKIGRPKGYTGTSPAALPLQNPSTLANPLLSGVGAGLGMLGLGLGGGLGLGSIADPPSNVIMVTNLPALIAEEQIKELFSPFGEVCLSSAHEVNPPSVQLLLTFFFLHFIVIESYSIWNKISKFVFEQSLNILKLLIHFIIPHSLT